MPLEMQGHVYPIELSQVQYEIDLSYDPTAEYAGFLKDFSLGLRDDLFGILTPGAVFPSGYDPTVADVNSALIQTLPEDTRYSEPDILQSRAYNTPLAVNPTTVISTDLLDFKTQETTFVKNDLLTIGDPSSPSTEAAWPVIAPFTPYSSSKTAQVLYENLQIQKILQWQPGIYEQGQVFRNPSVENSLLVVLKNFEYLDATLPPDSFILEGVLSAPKDFQPWQVGTQYYANNETTGFYDPDVIAMDQELNPDTNGTCQKLFFEPAGVDNLYYRVGWYCFVPNFHFTLLPSTNTTPGAQASANVSNLQVSLPILKSGGTYEAGSWLKTPAIGSGPTAEVDPYYYYVDQAKGLITKYAYINNTFTFLPSAGQTLADSFDGLIANGVISLVATADAMVPQPLFQYEPRFEPQTILSYRASAKSPTEYYFSLTGFTPTSISPNDLIEQGFISRIDTDPDIALELQRQFTPNPVTGIATLCPPVPMFVFSPGDTTLFRQQSTVVSYVATQHFTPLFTPGVYIAAGVLVPSNGENSSAIPFFTPANTRRNEDLILSEDGKNIYRTIRYFTATSPVFNWDGEDVVDTARIEELSGNVLRIVTLYECEQQIRSPNGPDTSGVKLGIAQITLRAKNALGAQNVFVWENTDFSNVVPALSYSSGGKKVFQPVSYGSGTLAL